MLPMTSLRALASASSLLVSGRYLACLSTSSLIETPHGTQKSTMTTSAEAHSRNLAQEAARKSAAEAQFNKTHHAFVPEDTRGHGPVLEHQPGVGPCAKGREFVRMVDPVAPSAAHEEDESAAQHKPRDAKDAENGYLASS